MNVIPRRPVPGLLRAACCLLFAAALPLQAQSPIVPPNLHPCNHRTNLVISEFRYRMVGTSDFLPFVKISNAGAEATNIGGYQITGTVSATIPANTVLQPAQSHVVLFAGNLSTPPFPPPVDINGTLELRDTRGAVLLHIEYSSDAPWPVQAYAGHSLVLSNPSYGENDPRAWSASPRLWQLDVTGTTPVPAPRGTLRLNELKTGTGGFLEIYNPSTTAAPLNGFYLTANENLNFSGGAGSSYNLPSGDSVPAGGYYSIPLTTLPFTLASTGGQVFMVDSLNGSAVVDGLRYGAQDPTVSFGRTPNGLGGFVRLTSATSGASNSAALTDAVVISEIMYHPASEPAGVNYEFIELYNRSGAQVDLRDWRLRGSIAVDFNESNRSYTIPAGGRLVVPGDRGDFRDLYGLPSVTWLTNGYDGNGKLPNSGGTILLQTSAGVGSPGTELEFAL